MEIAPPGISLSFAGNPIASGGSYGFGSVDLGENATVTVTISNPGGGALENIVASIPSGGANFSLLTHPPATLAAGGSATFQLRFAPQDLGAKSGTLRVTSNATPSPYNIQLSGTGVDTIPPVITVDAADLDVICDDPAKTDLVDAWLAANGGATATDNSGSVTWTNDFTGMPTVCDPATITFTASDPSGNTATTSAQLTIIDNTPPVIDLPATGITVETDGQGNAADLNAWLASNGGASASDTCSAVTWSNDFTGLDGTLPQTVEVIFTTSDSCGNSITTSAPFTIEDTVPPEITQPAQDFYGDCEGDPEEQMAAFLANNGGANAIDIGSAVTWTNDFGGTLPDCRNYVTVTFTASDWSGNTATTSSRFFLFPPGSIWVGPEEGSWATAGHWHNGIPSAATDAYVDLFDFQDSTVAVSGTRSVKSLFVGEGDTVRIANGSQLSVAGSEIENDGLIEMGFGSTSATFRVAGEVTLHGSGVLKLTGSGANLIRWQTNAANDVLTLGSDHEITTDADTVADTAKSAISGTLINQGTVTADEGGLALYSAPKTNEGLFRAIRGGTLRLNSTTLTNTNGSIFIDKDSRFEIASATLTGGEIFGEGVLGTSGTVILDGELVIGPEITTSFPTGTLIVASNLLNDGLIQVGGGGNTRVEGPVTLSGSGKIRLQGGGSNQIVWRNNAANDFLTLGPDHEITTDADTLADNTGSRIPSRLINQGTVTADEGGLFLYSATKTNEGLFRAIRGGTLGIANGVLTNYSSGILTGGRWEVISEGSPTLMDIQGASIHTLAADTLVRLSGEEASLPQLAPLAHVHGVLSLESGKSFSTAGTLNVTGVLEFGLSDGSIHGYDAEKLLVNGDVDFTGARIHIRDRGLIAGAYDLVQWTGSATGVPVLENIPPGLNHSLVLDPAAKTLRLILSYSEFKIHSLAHNPDTGTTTINYRSVDGVVHSVKGTENFVDYVDLPDTEIGTGALLQYIHQLPIGSEKYFYIFSTNAP